MFKFKFIIDQFQSNAMSGPFTEGNMRAKWLSELCPSDLSIAFAPNSGQAPIYCASKVKIVEKLTPGWWNHYSQNYSSDFFMAQDKGQHWSLGPNVDIAIVFPHNVPLVVSSRYHRDIVVRAAAYPQNKLFVIPNMVDPGLFYPEEKPTNPIVGWVGHDIDAARIKGPEVIAYLAKQFPDVQFEMILSTPPVARQAWLPSELPNLKMICQVPHWQMPAVMRRWHVLICSSKDENCPNHVLEAMSSGVPVIAAAVGGIPEVAKSQCLIETVPESGTTAYVDNKPWSDIALQKFADKLRLFLHDSSKQRDLTELALRESRYFHPQLIARRWFEFIYLCRDLYS